MPYRRLPNTDNARLKALKVALKKIEELPPFNLAFSQESMQNVKFFFPEFEQTINIQRQAYNNQIKRNKEYTTLLKRAKIYISHFIQILNFAIIREELPSSARIFYGLDEDSKTVPIFNTEADVIYWGNKVIEGEKTRLSNGGKLMSNPTVAVVKVMYEKFLEAYKYQKALQVINTRSLAKVAELRKEADKIILQMWNEVEKSFCELNEDEKRQYAAEYGVKYVYRTEEKEKMKQKEYQYEMEKEIM